MNDTVTTFKIRIDSIADHAIGFELFAGERVDDAYVNVLNKGSYASKDRLLLTPKQFVDFANRLIAYVYTKKPLKLDELVILWELRCIIYDNEHQSLGSSIFHKKEEELTKLSEKRQRELKERKERKRL